MSDQTHGRQCKCGTIVIAVALMQPPVMADSADKLYCMVEPQRHVVTLLRGWLVWSPDPAAVL